MISWDRLKHLDKEVVKWLREDVQGALVFGMLIWGMNQNDALVTTRAFQVFPICWSILSHLISITNLFWGSRARVIPNLLCFHRKITYFGTFTDSLFLTIFHFCYTSLLILKKMMLVDENLNISKDQ